MSLRYLDAGKVTLPSRAPLFVEEGHCQWCNKELTGKATKFCRPTEGEKQLSWDYVWPVESECGILFSNWWYSRSAYVRATFIRDNFTCQKCGYHEMQKDRPWLPDLSNLECDHITPLARGGKTTMDNLQALCRVCNRKKGIRIPSDVEMEELTRVIPSKDNSKCPYCGSHGYQILPWEPPEYYDPLMLKVKCGRCGEVSYIGPKPLKYSNRGVKQCQ